MDSTSPASAAGLARELGTSVPRVVRAAERLRIPARQPNRRFAFTPSQAEQVRRELGVVVGADGLSRTEIVVLAALRNAPLGLVSIRAVARRGGISPTAGGRALRSLLGKGLVTKTREIVAAGRAREMTAWRANLTHPRWPSLEPILQQVRHPSQRSRRDEKVPPHLRHLFWNTAPEQLDVRSAGSYIARRLLRAMDLQGLAWGAKTLSAEDWLGGAKARGLSSGTRRLAHNLAEGAGR
jgi:hypothetical protein